MRWPVVIPLFALALAGCASHPPAPASAVPSATQAPLMLEGHPAFQAWTTKCQTHFAAAVADPAIGGAGLTCAFREARPVLAGIDRAILEARFAGPADTMKDFRLQVVSPACAPGSLGSKSCSLAEATDPKGDLRLELDPAFMAAHGADDLQAYATFSGLAPDNDVEMAIALFAGTPPAGFTQLR